MKRALATLFAATAMAAASAPALAQDGYALPPPPPPMVVDPHAGHLPAPPPAPVVQYAQPVVYPAPPAAYPAPYPPAPHPQAQYHDAAMEYHAPHGLPPMPSLGYTEAERDGWLADCRAQYYGEGRKKGGLIGGLLGAIGGGILGHEVTDGNRTRRIGGTLIGAGVGGLAGLAIGAAIGGASDDERIDDCEAYLRHHTGGYRAGPDHGYGYGYGYYGYTTVMVPVQVQSAYTYSTPIRREHSEVIEEVIEETVVVPVKATKYVEAAPAPAATKYVKGKTVRATK